MSSLLVMDKRNRGKRATERNRETAACYCDRILFKGFTADGVLNYDQK